MQKFCTACDLQIEGFQAEMTVTSSPVKTLLQRLPVHHSIAMSQTKLAVF